MPELENVEKVKVAGFVDPRPRKNKNAERIKKDEEELQELLKAKEQGGQPAEEIKEVPDAKEGNQTEPENQNLSKEERVRVAGSPIEFVAHPPSISPNGGQPRRPQPPACPAANQGGQSGHQMNGGVSTKSTNPRVRRHVAYRPHTLDDKFSNNNTNNAWGSPGRDHQIHNSNNLRNNFHY